MKTMRPRGLIVFALPLALGALAAGGPLPGAVAALSATAGQPDPFPAMNSLRVTPPAPAPEVTFEQLDGQPTRLATLRGRPLLLTFFTTW